MSLSVAGHLVCFHILATVNNAALNIVVHVSFQISVFRFFEHISRSGIAESYSSSTFSFLRNCHTVLSGCTNLYYNQQYTKVIFSLHPHQHFFLVVFFDDRHFDRNEVISHCGFDLHFSED